ncbi:MAG: PhzF family phenazine biosynthesis protein [Archaeoglobaceae archaeon]|nr:PhzF family phenazine biosynthesis protein [Archaeoglobaceae archaeon]
MNLKFYIVDVFAEKKYTGNQLAVFRNAGMLSDEQMQEIAREMNYSETTFILSEKWENGCDVRIFTPEREVPFAGHPTLGTAYVIQREIIRKPIKTIILNLKIGQIPVTRENDILWMRQKPPVFGKTLESNRIAQVLNIDKKDIDRFPIQEVSTGLPFIVVPLKSLDALKRVQIDKERYFKLIEGLDAKAILVFCPETYNNRNHLNARVFADFYGVSEDPATGSANGCLAAYLVKHRYFDTNNIDIRVEQGYEIKRPSLLFLKAEEKENGDIDVMVGGKVVMVARGEFV